MSNQRSNCCRKCIPQTRTARKECLYGRLPFIVLFLALMIIVVVLYMSEDEIPYPSADGIQPQDMTNYRIEWKKYVEDQRYRKNLSHTKCLEIDCSSSEKHNLKDYYGEEFSYKGELRDSMAFGEGLGRYIDRPQVTIDGTWLENKRHGLGT